MGKLIKWLNNIISKTPFLKNLNIELDDYRESINQHEEELRELYTVIEKLKEELDEHKLMLGNQTFFDTNLNLTFDEKRILLMLYASDCLLSKYDLSKKLRIDSCLIDGYFDDLSLKGVPIIKQKSLNNELFYSLDPKFKELQAKQNILQVTSVFSQRMLQENTI